MKSFIPQNDRQKSSIASAAQMRNIGKHPGMYNASNFVDNRPTAILQRQMVESIQRQAVHPFQRKFTENYTPAPQQARDVIAPSGGAIQKKKSEGNNVGAGAQIAMGQCCNGRTVQKKQVIQRGGGKAAIGALSRISSSIGSLLKAIEKSKEAAKEASGIFGVISGGLNTIAGLLTMIEGVKKDEEGEDNSGRAITGVLGGGATMIGGVLGGVGAGLGSQITSDFGAGLTIAGNIAGIAIKIMDWQAKKERGEDFHWDDYVATGAYIFSDAFNILAKTAAFIPGGQGFAAGFAITAASLAVIGAGAQIGRGIYDWWHGRRRNDVQAQGAPLPPDPKTPLINSV